MSVQVYYTMIWSLHKLWNGLPRWLSGEDSACQHRRHARLQFDPRIGKSPWRRKWQATPVLLSGESHRQRSPVGYSLQHHRGSETTQHTHTQIRILKRSHSLLTIYSHAKLLQCYWPHSLLCLLHTVSYLYTTGGLCLLIPHHLILPSSLSTPTLLAVTSLLSMSMNLFSLCFILLLDFTYRWNQAVFVFLWCISFSIIPSRSICGATNDKILFLVAE